MSRVAEEIRELKAILGNPDRSQYERRCAAKNLALLRHNLVAALAGSGKNLTIAIPPRWAKEPKPKPVDHPLLSGSVTRARRSRKSDEDAPS